MAPLWMRLQAAYILHHIGGVHSGAAIASVMWLAYDLSRRLIEHCPNCFSTSVYYGIETVLRGLLLAILTLACIGAHPWVRRKHHNVFEVTHRALGWSGLVTLWAADSFGRAQEGSEWNGYALRYLFTSPSFWLQTVATLLVAAPWFCVRKMPVSALHHYHCHRSKAAGFHMYSNVKENWTSTAGAQRDGCRMLDILPSTKHTLPAFSASA